MPIIESKTDSVTKTDETETIRHLANCKRSFSYFLQYEVKTVDPQEGIFERPAPDWPYVYDVARQFQEFNRNILLKSRQTWLTWEISAFALWQSLFYPPSQGLIISKGGRYSRETGERADYIFKHLSFSKDIEMKTNAQFNEYSFPGIENSKFMCLPADEDVVRTFSPSYIILDEAAYFPYPGRIMDAIGPLLEKKVKFICGSTPNGEDRLFYPMWHGQSDINKIELWWYDRPDRDQAWFDALKQRPNMTSDKIAREYLHSFETPAGLPVYQNWNGLQGQACFDRYIPTKPIIRGLDRGYESPACLWAQENDDDQLMPIHEMKGNRVPRDKWLADVQKTTAALFPDHKGGFLDYAASDFFKPESDGITWKDAMKNFGIHIEKAKKDHIDRRVTATRNRLGLRADGKFGIIVDPDHCPQLIAALAGGYHYPDKPDHQGELKPVKDEHSHLADCLGHICDNHYGNFGKKEELKTIRLGVPQVKKFSMA